MRTPQIIWWFMRFCREISMSRIMHFSRNFLWLKSRLCKLLECRLSCMGSLGIALSIQINPSPHVTGLGNGFHHTTHWRLTINTHCFIWVATLLQPSVEIRQNQPLNWSNKVNFIWWRRKNYKKSLILSTYESIIKTHLITTQQRNLSLLVSSVHYHGILEGVNFLV